MFDLIVGLLLWFYTRRLRVLNLGLTWCFGLSDLVDFVVRTLSLVLLGWC